MNDGLENVVAAETVLSEVDGLAGRLVIRGHSLDDLAGKTRFEDAAHLLWEGFFDNLPADLAGPLGNARAEVFAETIALDDRLLARTSHLPHVAAAALAKAIGRDCADQVGAFCGTGFYDSTRVASGSIDMWHDVLMTNAPAVAEELRAFKKEVERVYDDLQSGRFGDVAQFLERAREARAELLKGRGR